MPKFLSKHERAIRLFVPLSYLIIASMVILLILSGCMSTTLIPTLMAIPSLYTLSLAIAILPIAIMAVIIFTGICLFIINKTKLFMELRATYVMHLLKIALWITIIQAIVWSMKFECDFFYTLTALLIDSTNVLRFFALLTTLIALIFLPLLIFSTFLLEYHYIYAIAASLATTIVYTTLAKIYVIMVFPSFGVYYAWHYNFIFPAINFALYFSSFVVILIFGWWYDKEHEIAVRAAEITGVRPIATFDLGRGYAWKPVEKQRWASRMAFIIALIWIIIIIITLYLMGYLEF